MTFKIKPTKEWGIFFLFFGLVLINHCKDKKNPENIEYTLIHRVDWSILVKRDHIIYDFVKLKIIKMCSVYIALNSTKTCYSFFVYNNAHKVEYVHITLIWYQYTKISNRRVAMYNYVIDSFFIQWKSSHIPKTFEQFHIRTWHFISSFLNKSLVTEVKKLIKLLKSHDTHICFSQV